MSLPLDELARRARRLRVILLDVDGVLTSGAVTYTSDDEILSFHIRDGLAIALARRVGLEVAVLSGRGSQALLRRAEELGIDPIVVGRSDKAAAFAELLAGRGWSPDEVAGIGDDLQDLPVLSLCGLSYAPADAAAEVRDAVDRVLSRTGGQAAVREMIEEILAARGEWDGLVRSFLQG